MCICTLCPHTNWTSVHASCPHVLCTTILPIGHRVVIQYYACVYFMTQLLHTCPHTHFHEHNIYVYGHEHKSCAHESIHMHKDEWSSMMACSCSLCVDMYSNIVVSETDLRSWICKLVIMNCVCVCMWACVCVCEHVRKSILHESNTHMHKDVWTSMTVIL